MAKKEENHTIFCTVLLFVVTMKCGRDIEFILKYSKISY